MNISLKQLAELLASELVNVERKERAPADRVALVALQRHALAQIRSVVYLLEVGGEIGGPLHPFPGINDAAREETKAQLEAIRDQLIERDKYELLYGPLPKEIA